ncbi:MAG TPA: orotate phosphoribosyltransferase [Flavobacteriales bacterium]|jgi:orotate phosphoribosyltransferase|nr:orotate phosphoribosyltransferase [Flavobacteriales bacterium]
MVAHKNIDSALRVSEFLLQIKAVQLSPEKPFTWASGILSPIYCDNRRILSFPKIRTHIRQEMVACVQENYGRPDLIAGVATGGIAIGVMVAQELGLPFVYVRPKPKEHGMGNQIEGVIESGQSVIVIEDLISSGKSSLQAVAALRAQGCMVKGMISIMTYGLPEADENFKKEKCHLVSLTNYDLLTQQAVESGYISADQMDVLTEWRTDPKNWKKG